MPVLTGRAAYPQCIAIMERIIAEKWHWMVRLYP